MKSTGKTLLTFFTGAAAGVVAGLILAPKNGNVFKEVFSKTAGANSSGDEKSHGKRRETRQSTIIPIEKFMRGVGS